MQENCRVKRGFTLVELAIVLVIIGLLIGAVLVGMDMIKSAEIRSTIGQYEKFNAAANTFMTKYGSLPGDLNGKAAANFGFVTRDGRPGHGDGNGLIESCETGGTYAGCETLIFWRDLSQSGLIPYVLNTAADQTECTNAVQNFYPPAKLGRGIYFHVYAADGLNHYQLSGITGMCVTGFSYISTTLTPNEAFAIDSKIDDGMPLGGIVIARGGSNAANLSYAPLAPASGVCVTTDTGNPYNTANTDYANAPSCSLRLQMN